MHNIMLFNADYRPFDVAAVRRILQSEGGFRDVRSNEEQGDLLEAQYVESDDWTFFRLSGSRKSISLSGTSDAALRAALILQRHTDTPLRISDTDNSFDLILRDYPNVEALRGAIANAQAG
ncbi:MAG TPA: hypothetical protein VHY91_15100 [Pirellulales bacterium]|jgi:hypothetical protein|nr:hypothetical protein [Pirellulales bacterium]